LTNLSIAAARRLSLVLSLPLSNDADQLDLAFYADLLENVILMPPNGPQRSWRWQSGTSAAH
jgi:hypothetical protein